MVKHELISVKGKSVTAAVRDEVSYDFPMQDAMARDYANLSGLARALVPRIEARTGRKVPEQGVITALKRLKGELAPPERAFARVIAQSVVSVRTHVSRLSVERTRRTLQAASALLSEYQGEFMQVSESPSAITLIFDQRLHRTVRKAMGGAEILEEGEDGAAITVHSPAAIMTTPGCVSTFYNQLSRKRINVEDTVSCYTDTMMVVGGKDAGRAFEALTELIDEEAARVER